nr:immunoglobulin heavy chain junction region [Macaca mulatta]MOX65552.1 immunoglobulin heavy chain junction region [Macaca mulatta]
CAIQGLVVVAGFDYW